MTTDILPRPLPEREHHSELQVSQWRVITSEWIKLRSLRSSRYTLLAAVAVIIGFALLAASVTSGLVEDPDAGRREMPPIDATTISLAGVVLAQMIIGTLGVLMIAGEYSTGMIRSSLSAVPRRLPVLWGKVIVLSGVTLTLMLLAIFTAFLAAQPIMASAQRMTLSDDGVLRALVGAAVYLVGIGVLGITLGALLRNTAGAITSLFALLLVVPGLIGLVLPQSWTDAVTPYLPSNAGQAVTSTMDMGQDLLSPATGLAVFVAYLVVLLAAAGFALTRRDA